MFDNFIFNLQRFATSSPASNLHIYSNDVAAKTKTGTKLDDSTFSVKLNALNNESKISKMAVRTDAGFYVDGVCTVGVTGTSADKWRLYYSSNTQSVTELSSSIVNGSGWAESLGLSSVSDLNTIFWLKALSNSDELVTIDRGAGLYATGLVAAKEPPSYINTGSDVILLDESNSASLLTTFFSFVDQYDTNDDNGILASYIRDLLLLGYFDFSIFCAFPISIICLPYTGFTVSAETELELDNNAKYCFFNETDEERVLFAFKTDFWDSLIEPYNSESLYPLDDSSEYYLVLMTFTTDSSTENFICCSQRIDFNTIETVLGSEFEYLAVFPYNSFPDAFFSDYNLLGKGVVVMALVRKQ